MKIAYIVPLLVVLAIGCIGGGQEKPTALSYVTDGVAIIDYGTELPTAESGEETEVYIEVENIGGADATEINAVLFNYDGFTGVTQETILDLAPPTPGIPGDMDEAVWVLTAPEVEPNMINPIDLGVRVCYNYTTSGLADVVVVKGEEYKLMKRQGREGEIPVGGSTSASGPVAMTITSRSQPIILRSNSTSFYIRIEVENVGPGFVTNQSTDPSDVSGYGYLNSITLDIPSDLTIDTTDCDFTGDEIPITDPDSLKLRGYTNRIYRCRLDMSAGAVGAVYNTFKIRTRTDYHYCTDAINRISVYGENM